ncbi:hypothetical protein E2C01_085360 [Portunus trituberculatus]|uniref:Uncharacterized protein n=1 Tax=Portunus trituberculatus TaxID=210409 RepID=A0A5B7J6K2_PORTR|nr:hypothetical protein [Portunus trituberculatus]
MPHPAPTSSLPLPTPPLLLPWALRRPFLPFFASFVSRCTPQPVRILASNYNPSRTVRVLSEFSFPLPAARRPLPASRISTYALTPAWKRRDLRGVPLGNYRKLEVFL